MHNFIVAGLYFIVLLCIYKSGYAGALTEALTSAVVPITVVTSLVESFTQVRFSPDISIHWYDFAVRMVQYGYRWIQNAQLSRQFRIQHNYTLT